MESDMRKITIILTHLFLLLLLSQTALAMPQYYLFNGVVRSVGGDNATMAAEQGFTVGTSLEYLFMLDAYVMGQMTYSNGEVEYDPLDIYAKLISGSMLEEVDGGYYLDENGAAVGQDSHRAFTRKLNLANIGRDHQNQILIGNEDQHLFFSSDDAGGWKGYLQAYDSAGRIATVYLDLELTSVTNEVPPDHLGSASLLPESAAMAFLGIGLMLLAGWVHRIRKRQTPQSAIPASDRV